MDTRRRYTQASMKQRVIAVTMLWVVWSVERKRTFNGSLWSARAFVAVHRGALRCTNPLRRLELCQRLDINQVHCSKPNRLQWQQHEVTISFPGLTFHNAGSTLSYMLHRSLAMTYSSVAEDASLLV